MAKVVLKIIGGQNLLSKKQKPVVIMKSTKEPGVVIVEKKEFHYLGLQVDKNHERSAGKAATGAIVGGVLTGGIGAIAGAALGGRKKDTSTAMIGFVDKETNRQFDVQIEYDKNTKVGLSSFKISNIEI